MRTNHNNANPNREEKSNLPAIKTMVEPERLPCIRNYAELPHSLFAHIHLDHLLFGSHLQYTYGNGSFPNLIINMLEYILKNDTGISQESIHAIRNGQKQLLSDFESIGYCEAQKRNIIRTLEQTSYLSSKEIDKQISGLAQKVYNDILNKKETIFLIKWGNSSLDITNAQSNRFQLDKKNEPNAEKLSESEIQKLQKVHVYHQMCVKVIKNSDGSHTLLIINTADGIELHLSNDGNKLKHRNAIAFHIPKETSHIEIIKYIKELLSPHIKSSINKPSDKTEREWRIETDFDPVKFYSEVIAKIYMLDAKEISPRKILYLHTQGQWASTCATRIWFPIIHTRINRKAFHEFLVQLRYQSILDYYRILKDKNSLDLPIVSHTLIPACQKFARTLEKYHKRARKRNIIIVPPELADKMLKQIQAIEEDVRLKAALRKASESIPQKQTVVFDCKPKNNSLMKLESSLLKCPLFELEKLEKEAIKKEDEKSLPPFPVLPKREGFNYPLDFLKSYYASLNDIYKRNCHSFLIDEVEKMFFAMPSDSKSATNYWNKLEKKDIKETLSYLKGIIELFGSSCYHGKISNNILPRQILVGNICALMASFITRHYFKNQPHFSVFSPLLPKVPFISDPTEAASFDPIVDSKMEEFEKLATEIINNENFIKDGDKTLKPKGFTEIVDYYDIVFLEKYIDKTLFKELDELDKNYDTANTFDNARINLYRYCRSRVNENKQYQIDKKPSPQLNLAIDDYMLFMHASGLYSQCASFGSNYRGHFTSDITTEPKDKKNVFVNFAVIPYYYRKEDGERHLIDGRISRYSFANYEDRTANLTFANFYKPGSNPAMDVLKEKCAIYSTKYLNKSYLSDSDRKKMEEGAISSSNAKLTNIFNEKGLDYPFSVRSFAFHAFMKDRPRLILTRDFYDSHLDLINEVDHQANILQHLFQPHVLMQLLNENPGFAVNLHEFMKKIVNFHTQNQEISKGGVFAYHLCYLVLVFLKAHPKKDRMMDVITWIQGLENGLLNILNVYKTSLKNSDNFFGPYESTLRMVESLLRLYCISKSLHQEQEFSPDTIRLLLSCQLFSTINEIEKDPYQRESTAYDINAFFEEHFFASIGRLKKKIEGDFKRLRPNQQEKIIRDLVSDLLIPDFVPDAKFDVKIEFPRITVTHGSFKVVVDLHLGKIIDSKKYFIKKKPGQWNKLIEGFFGDIILKTLVDEREYSTVYEFKHGGQEFKITYPNYKAPKEVAYQHLLQQKLVDGQEYVMCTQNSLQNTIPCNLGDEGFDMDKRWWQSIDQEGSKKYYCTDPKLNYLYEVIAIPEVLETKQPNKSYLGYLQDAAYGIAFGIQEKVDVSKLEKKYHFECHLLKSSGERTGYTLINPEDKQVKTLVDYLSRFEQSRFIQIWQTKNENKSNPKFLLKLLRYNLEWEGHTNKKGEIEFLWTKNPDFKLIFSPVASYVPNFEHFLVMENRKTRERIALVPKQKFLPSSEVDNNLYHTLKYDINNEYRDQYFRPEGYYSGYQARHNNSCQYEMFRIREKSSLVGALVRKEDEWVANSAAGSLFLAYLCLGKYQPQMAMAALRDTKKIGGVQASFEEVAYIRDIIDDVPNKDFKPELYKNVRIKEPNTIAVRLYAACLLRDQRIISYNKSANFPTVQPIISRSDKLLEQRISDASNFYGGYYGSSFDELLPKLYFQYLKALEHISADLRLSLEDERSLLQTIMMNIDKHTASPVNRYHWLEVKYAIKRREKILFNYAKHGAISNIELNEGNEIKSIINQHQVIAKTHQKLLFNELPLEISFENWGSYGSKYFASSETVDEICVSYKAEEALRIDQLDINTSAKDFQRSWIYYYEIAIGPGNEIAKANLKKYATRILHYQNAGTRMQGNPTKDVAELCKLLIYILNNPMSIQDDAERNKFWTDRKGWPTVKRYDKESTRSFIEEVARLCSKFAKEKPINIKFQGKNTNIKITPVKFESSISENALNQDIKSFEMLSLKETKRDNLTLCLEVELKDFLTEFNQIKVPEVALPQIFVEEKKQDPFFKLMNDNFCLDLREGMKQNAHRRIQENIYRKHLDNTEAQKKILRRLRYQFNREEVQLQNDRHILLAKANKGLIGDQAKHSSQCNITGKELTPITFANLMWLYLQADLSLFYEKTHLDRVMLQDLYQSIHEYLIKATMNQHRARVIQQIDVLLKAKKDSPEYSDALILLGELLVTKRAYNPDQHTEILIFEYLDDKILRPEQIALLESLLKSNAIGFNNEVIQLIMGGGKSKVLLPLLALKKATGTNLSIIEVPSALYETNKADLGSTTMELFGVEGIAIDFDRNTNITTQKLHDLHTKLNNARTGRQYIITHSDATKSLQLKYLELLEGEGRDDEILKLQKILLSYRTCGDAIIDEGDTVLDPKLELNYPNGVANALPLDVLATVQKFFRLFAKVEVNCSGKMINLRDVALGKEIIVLDSDWDQAMQKLLDVALSDKSLEYWRILKELPQEQIPDLKKFLLNKNNLLPDSVKTLNDEEKDALGFIKGQLSLFKHCLKQKSNEHYGFPVSDDFQGCKHVAIPYIANNTPNEKSEFGMIYEIINYTLLLQDQRNLIPIELIKRMVEDFKFMAKQEVAIKFGRISIEETKVNKEFINLTTISLNQIFPHDESLKKFQQIISNSTKARDYIVLNYILSKIKDYPKILRANAINHVHQYRSAQTMTGTPWNAECFHPRFNFDREKSFGTDGKTLDLLIQKNPHIRVAESKDPVKLIDEFIIKHSKTHKIHAWIDVGALFKGVDNEMVARLLAKALSSRQGNRIKHILFYNQDNVLSAITCSQPNEPAIKLYSTDPKSIIQKIGSSPEECFTYYDQRHTTGTDIKQVFDAIGIVTVDRDTKTRDLLQGVMRLRQFFKSQEIEIILPSEVVQLKNQNHNNEDKDANRNAWQIQDVLQLTQRNQNLALANFNLRATLDKMDHIIREHLLEMIYEENDIAKKRLKRTAFAEAFIYMIPKNPFPLVEGEFETQKILDCHFKNCIDKFKRLLAKDNIACTSEMLEKITNELIKIKDRGLKNCLFAYENSAGVRDNGLQNMKQKEQENQRQVENACLRANDRTQERAVVHKNWGGIPKNDNDDSAPIQFFTMNSAIKMNNPSIKWDFSGAVKLTENFVKTIEAQKNNMGKFIKPVQFFMVIKDPGSKSLRILVMAPEEFHDILAYYHAQKASLMKEGYEIWFKTTHDVLLTGTSETIDPLRFPDYKILLEQIRFFNGDIDLLIQERCSDWFLSDLNQKFETLRNIILPNHNNQKKYLEQLELTIKQEITEHSESKINTETLGRAIKDSNLELLDSLLKNLAKHESPRARRFLLNTPFGSKQEVLLGIAIQKGNIKIVQRLLAEPEFLSYLSYYHSPIRQCISHFNKSIYETILADRRCFPDTDNLEHWVELTQEVLASDNDEMIKPFLSKLNKLAHPSVLRKLTPTLFENLYDKDLSYINAVLRRLSFGKSQEEVARDFILQAAKNNKNQLVIKLLEDWHANPPSQKILKYIVNNVSGNEACLLHDLSDLNLDLMKYLLEDKQQRFTPSHNKVDFWRKLLFAANPEQIKFIKDYIKATFNPAVIKAIENDSVGIEQLNVVINNSLQEVKHSDDEDEVKRNREKIEHDCERLQHLIDLYPGTDNKALCEKLVTMFIEYHINNSHFHKDEEIFKTLFSRMETNSIKILNNLFQNILEKHRSGYVTRIFSGINFKQAANQSYGLHWFKFVVDHINNGKDTWTALQVGEVLLNGGVFQNTTEFNQDAFFFDLCHWGKLEAAKKRMEDSKLTPNMHYRGQPYLLHSIINTDTYAAENLLKLNADPNVRYQSSDAKNQPGSEYNGYTPLMFCMEKQRGKSQMNALLDSKADPHVRNKRGKTALDLFIEKNDKDNYWNRTEIIEPLKKVMGIK